VFQNRALRKIFGSEKDKVTGECRRHIVRSFMFCFCSCDQIKKNDMVCVCVCVRACVRVRGRRGTYWVLVGKPEE